MRRVALATLATFLLMTVAPVIWVEPSEAGGRGGVRTRVFVGVGAGWGPGWWGPGWGPGWWGPGWGGPAGWGAPGWWGPLPAVVVQEPTVFIQRPAVAAPAPAPPTQHFWHYCQSAGAYYPNVPSCPEPWIKVPPRPE